VQPKKTLERVATPEGSLELRQHGPRSFLITLGGRVLMTSEAHRSETELAERACAAIAARARPRMLLGGLGMGFTLRAALDHLPKNAHVTVVDLNPVVVGWCRGPLAVLTQDALADKRVSVIVDDVARVIRGVEAASFDAIVLDLYEGPHHANRRTLDPLYGAEALRRSAEALTSEGVLAIWSEESDQAFEARLAVDFRVETHRGPRGGRTHVIYVGTRKKPRRAR
jgi:spermidine synthase